MIQSVAWVNNYWVAVVLGFLVTINLVSAFDKSESPALLLLISAAVLLLIYPYIHYRVNGGRIQRIPPRFYENKPAFN